MLRRFFFHWFSKIHFTLVLCLIWALRPLFVSPQALCKRIAPRKMWNATINSLYNNILVLSIDLTVSPAKYNFFLAMLKFFDGMRDKTYRKWSIVSFFPFNQCYLSKNQRYQQNDYHFGMHGIMTFMLFMHSLMFEPVNLLKTLQLLSIQLNEIQNTIFLPHFLLSRQLIETL